MEVLHLRTMTLKSIIGFGLYKDYSVNDMFIQNKRKELLSMYYRLDRISFNQEIKDKLFITKERELNKPGKDMIRATEIIKQCMNDYYDSLNRLMTETAIMLRCNKIKRTRNKLLKSRVLKVERINKAATTKARLQTKNHGK